jgi:regulator of protease activity HflC (stomatin/prohibitin superfamily)
VRYDVHLLSVGPNKIRVIQVVLQHTGLGLKDAKDLVERAPCIVARNLSEEESTRLLGALLRAGAWAKSVRKPTIPPIDISLWKRLATFHDVLPRGGAAMTYREIIIKNTHRGLRYEDGVLAEVLEAGRYTLPRPLDLGFYRRPNVEIVLVDIRERDLTIRGQEILTADKVALRVSIVVRFRVTDPRAAVEAVENYEDRIYADVQLAARRSLAATSLEDILTDRNRLSEDILADVKETAAGYGVNILRADVKDLVFPGNLQEIMNRVLAAERTSQAQLVDARTKAEIQRIDAAARADIKQAEAQAQAEAQRRAAEAEAEVLRIKTEADIEALREREQSASAYAEHPALLRLTELETLGDLARTANARIYVNFNGHAQNGTGKDDEE